MHDWSFSFLVVRRAGRSLVASTALAAVCSASGSACKNDPSLTEPDASDSVAAGCTAGTPKTIGPEDMTPLGVTPAQLLANVAGTHVATLTWGTAVSGQDVTVTPTGTTILTIDVTPATNGIQFSQPVSTTSGSPIDHSICGPGLLTIAARVRFVTADGGFNETWDGSLFSDDGRSVIFDHDLNRPPLAGSFAVTYTGTEKWDSTSTNLSASFDAQGARGDVHYSTAKTFSAGPNSGGSYGLFFTAASWVPGGVEGGVQLDAGLAGDAEEAEAQSAD